ncbi:ABC transporter substrate-binding protein [Lachnoclostridium sp. Marseille-P6806]|uniref:ABC transporter substrate-binding protein n=1 Tax=Lachnoclostridium sp. Marseille-P6806 TaxID=2364793 RepID=UPI001030EFC1|nr:extracellular solute-binding protein [Lachnoclostridium sp. Marseille-P6806]
MRRHVKVTTMLLILAMAASIATGCGEAAETSESASAAGGEQAAAAGEIDKNMKADIVVGGWPSGDDAFEAAMAGFQEEYPNIHVELQFTDTSAHHQNLQTSLAAGSGAPDVAMVEGAYVAQYRNSTALADLNTCGAQNYRNDFVSFKWDQCISDDGTAMRLIPWDIGPTTLFYRTDIFEKAGLPTDPVEVDKILSTWDGVLSAAEQVKEKTGAWFVPDASYFYQLLFQNRDYYDEDLNLKLEREGDIDCLNTIIKFRAEGLDMNVDMWSTEAYAAYADGTIASVASGAWFGGFLKTDIDPNGAGHWAAANLPAGIGVKNWGGSFLAIPEQSKNKAAAWAFIQYMVATSEGQNAMFAAVDYFPAYTPAYDDPIYAEEDPYFGGQKTKALWASLAEKLEPVYTTQMDTTAEGQIFTSVNQGLEEGLDAEGIRSLLASNIETAAKEIREQQIQTLKDAGVWNK